MWRLERFWIALETLPGAVAVRKEWQERTGAEFASVERFLRPTETYARSFPCPDPCGDGCPRRIVEHTSGGLAAVCGELSPRCETLSLSWHDLILWEVDMAALAKRIAGALELRFRFQATSTFRTWLVGQHESEACSPIPVYLLVALTRRELANQALKLILERTPPLVALTPTADLYSPEIVDLLRAHDSSLAPLEQWIGAEPGGTLRTFSASLGWLPRSGLPRPAAQQVFHRGGDVWTLTYQGTTAHVKDGKGLRYLAALLRNPGRHFTPTELDADAGETLPGSRTPPVVDLAAGGFGSLGPTLDRRALHEYRKRLEELERDLSQAVDHNDLPRAEKLRDEKQAIATELASSLGRGGRPRIPGDPRKRVHDRVTKALRRALAVIGSSHPALSTHLESSLRLGGTLAYQPPGSVPWQF
jgi:hypothetical protein